MRVLDSFVYGVMMLIAAACVAFVAVGVIAVGAAACMQVMEWIQEAL